MITYKTRVYYFKRNQIYYCVGHNLRECMSVRLHKTALGNVMSAPVIALAIVLFYIIMFTVIQVQPRLFTYNDTQYDMFLILLARFLNHG